MRSGELTQGVFPAVRATGRTVGFFLLIALMVPVQLVMRQRKTYNAFAVPFRFHCLLVRLLGIKVRVSGRMAPLEDGLPTLFVSNHSSYLDIPVLGSLIKASFVSKSEVAAWPLIGGLARLQNTVFIERRATRSGVQRDGLRGKLEQGNHLILFPEGTSSDGHRTLPFKSSLFSIVEQELPQGGYVRIQPVSVVCTQIGSMPMGRFWRHFYAWYGDMTFVKHLWDVFKIADFTVDVIFHQPVFFGEFGDRKLLADACQRVVARGVDRCVTGRH